MERSLYPVVGFFLWLAENLAMHLGAWHYPDQLETWRLVHPAKFGAWALLISVSFSLVDSWQTKTGPLRWVSGSRHTPESASMSCMARAGCRRAA